MKCPKCGFNSFEFHDNCKKCGNNLASFKSDLNIKPVILDTDRQLQASVPFRTDEEQVQSAVEKPVDTFTWDTPETDDTARSTDTGFSGFELDFLKGEEKPESSEFDFSFGDEPVPPTPTEPVVEDTAAFDDFAFYEETIEPGQDQPFTGATGESADMDSLFGETGVIGEILPEKLQEEVGELELDDIIEETSSEAAKYENEFDWGTISAIGEEAKDNTAGNDTEVKKDTAEFTDFEKEFESIFQIDEMFNLDKQGN